MACGVAGFNMCHTAICSAKPLGKGLGVHVRTVQVTCTVMVPVSALECGALRLLQEALHHHQITKLSHITRGSCKDHIWNPIPGRGGVLHAAQAGAPIIIIIIIIKLPN
jgi:hypothetical protein